MANLASFNIFWYPRSDIGHNERSEDDLDLIRQVLTNLDAHAFAFQEIVNLEHLEELLQGIEGHDYRLRREPGGEWLTSGDPTDTVWHKIACAYDADAFELIDAAPVENPERYPGYYYRRNPYALHLRERATGGEITLVAVHCKSGLPGIKEENEQDPERRDLREREAAFLAAWLSGDLEEQPGEEETGTEEGPTPYFPKPPTDDVIVMGDFNAIPTLEALEHLRQLPGWSWPAAAVVESPDPGLPAADPLGTWTTWLDKAVIDHVIVSPGLETSNPLIYAFDLDPALDQPPHSGTHWLRQTTDYRVSRGQDFAVLVADLYRISDHRPVRISVSLG